MTPFALAAICAEAYTSTPDFAAGDVHAIRRGDVLAFRGTACEADVLRDLDAIPVYDDEIGWCHRGFRDGARVIFQQVVTCASPRLIVTGHSLGGALAVLTAARMAARHCPPARLVTFGAPRAGSVATRRLLGAVDVVQYRNGDDPVTEVPYLPGIFEHMVPLTQIGVAALDPVVDHFISGYMAALKESA